MKSKTVLLLAASAALAAFMLKRPPAHHADSTAPPQSAPKSGPVPEVTQGKPAGDSAVIAAGSDGGPSPQAAPGHPAPVEGKEIRAPAAEPVAPGYIPTEEEVETRMAGLRRKLSEKSAAQIRQRIAAGESPGLSVTPQPGAGEPAPLVVPYAIGTPSTPATLPAILATPESAAESEDAAKTAIIDKMRDDFIAAVNVPNASPADPDYQERWQAAQEASDHLYRLRFGHEDWVRAQIRAHRQSLADSGTGDAAYQAKALRRDSGEQVP